MPPTDKDHINMEISHAPPAAEQELPTPDTSHRERSLRKAIHISIIQQVIAFGISAVMFDGGEFFSLCFYSSLASWALIAAVVCHQATHRNFIPTRWILLIIMNIFWLLLLACVVYESLAFCHNLLFNF
jgi:fatty acid desaturase